jgi:hypothetical protein
MRDLRIFISYSHEDGPIATRFSNLLHSAFEPALAEVFFDRASISFGSSIKEGVISALRRADVLVAVIAGAQPASVFSWPGFEIGRFSAFWEDDHYKQGPHKDREKSGVIGQVIVLSNGKIPLGPEEGQRPVNLGISEERLADGDDEESLERSRRAAGVENGEVLQFLQDIERQVKDEPGYVRFAAERTKTLSDLVRDFKYEVFDVLRCRVRNRSKPTRQLIVRSRGKGSSLPDEATIASIAGASEVFGKSEGDPRLFKRTVEAAAPGSVRYESRWGDFKKSVDENHYGRYWCTVVEQAVIGAIREGAELDSNLVLISNRGQRYRVIATTVTTYFNDDSEVSLYLIEALQRSDGGDRETSNLLNCLTIVCRFRFAFLEGASPYFWRNFARSPKSARSLLMELDYLRSEAANAELDKPGVYEDFMTSEELTEMMRIWGEVDLELRAACNAVIAQRNWVPTAAELATIVSQLKRIHDEVKPFNTLLGFAVSDKLLSVFKRDHPVGELRAKT